MNSEDFRKYLHRHPELPCKEQATMAFIAEQLSELGIEYCPVSDAGLLARIEGKRGNLKRCVVLCADVSAMPIAELTTVEWASQSEGVMHAAGNDFNAALLYGVLKRLYANRDFEGTLLVLFQSGEMAGQGGARAILAEDVFKDYNVAAFISNYLDDSLEVGEIGFCPGRFMPSVDTLNFKVKNPNATGSGAAKDSVVALSDLIMRLYTFNSEVCSLVINHLSADGVAEKPAELSSCEGKMWSFDEKLRARVKDMIAHMTEEIEYKYDVEICSDVRYGTPCVENDAQLTYEAMLLADTLGYAVKDLERRDLSSDFGYYSQLYPSLYYSLGVGAKSGRALTATFLPDERAIAVGEEFIYQLALNILNK